MSEPKDEIQKLADEFRQCRSLLLALGDVNRQHLLTMMQMGECGGVRLVQMFRRAKDPEHFVGTESDPLRDGTIPSNSRYLQEEAQNEPS